MDLWRERGKLFLLLFQVFVTADMICCGPNSLKNFATDYLVLSVCGILTVMGSMGFIVWNEIFEKKKIKRENHLSNRKTWLTLSTHTKLVFVMLICMIVVGTFGFLLF